METETAKASGGWVGESSKESALVNDTHKQNKNKRRRMKRKKRKKKKGQEETLTSNPASGTKPNTRSGGDEPPFTKLISALANDFGLAESDIVVAENCESESSASVQISLKNAPDNQISAVEEGCLDIDQLPNADKIRALLPVSQVVKEARDLCETVEKLKFRGDDLQFRLNKIMVELKTDAYDRLPSVNIGCVTNLWQFLQSANGVISGRHSHLVNSIHIQQINAQRSKNISRQRVLMRKIDSLNRKIRDCKADATALNCIISLFGRTSIYEELQRIKETNYVRNSQGVFVEKAEDFPNMSFAQSLEQDKAKKTEVAKSKGAQDVVFGSGSLLSMLENSEDEHDVDAEIEEKRKMSEKIRQNQQWGKGS